MENFEQNDFTKEPSFVEAQNNFNEKGYLGVTAKDHEGIFSTPPNILVQNPGKTKAELMSDEEIAEYIEGTRANIIENQSIEKMKTFNEDLKENLKVTIAYLKSIGRLPEDFE